MRLPFEQLRSWQPELTAKDSLRAGAGAEPRRILLVTPRYFPYSGGVENHVYQVARRLAQYGAKMTVLATDPSRQLPAHEESNGVKIQRVRAWPAERDHYLAPEIYPIITNGDWDVVHVQSYHTLVAPLAMVAAWRAGIPYVITFHGGGHSSRLRHALRPLQRLLLRPLLTRADRLVATARFEIPFLARQLRLPDERFVFIPNGGDLLGVTETAIGPVEAGLIVSIGRLERYKGHHRAIAALPMILERRPDVRLWIMGTGPYESSLRELAQTLGVADRVKIHSIPACERERMGRELSKAALVVLFSEYETQPMAVLEALALGRPALVSDTSGLGELARQGLASAVAPESTSAQIASAILEQLHQPYVPPPINLPTWDDCAARLLALYDEIICCGRSPDRAT